jgi:hypothetical protein
MPDQVRQAVIADIKSKEHFRQNLEDDGRKQQGEKDGAYPLSLPPDQHQRQKEHRGNNISACDFK